MMNTNPALRLPAPSLPHWPDQLRPHSGGGRWITLAKRMLVACTATLGAQTMVAAQMLPTQAASMQVTPLVAAVGVSRQIAITSYWPLGCGPTDVTLDARDVSSTRTLVIRLARPSLGPCALFVVPYSHVIHYTPTFEGDLRIVVVTNDGELVTSQGSLKTRDLDGSYSQFDITGLWSDSANYGSGLTFVHGRTRFRSDQVFGTWFLYDVNGAPRWYTIQDVVWKTGGMEAEGNIYEAEATSHPCPPELTACPNIYARVMPLGRARIVFQNDRNARVFVSGIGGNVLFMSNLVREPIN